VFYFWIAKWKKKKDPAPHDINIPSLQSDLNIFCQGKLHMRRKLLGIISVNFGELCQLMAMYRVNTKILLDFK